MSKVPLVGVISHRTRVRNLYKAAVRNLEAFYQAREVFRYQAVLLRSRFDENKDVKDMRIAKSLLERGEDELFKNAHPLPKKFPESPGGVAFGRTVEPPDWVLDYWHPLEKAQYPDYFKTREQRKKEYVQLWEQKYGKYVPSGGH